MSMSSLYHTRKGRKEGVIVADKQGVHLRGQFGCRLGDIPCFGGRVFNQSESKTRTDCSELLDNTQGVEPPE